MRDNTLQVKQPKQRSLWRNRDYMLLWCGQAISEAGGSVSELAFPLLVLAVTGSPEQAGIVGALRVLPATFFSLPAGVLVDRWDRKRTMLLCNLGRFLSIASIPLAMLFGHLSLYQLYITSLAEGTLVILFSLSHSASLAQVVTDEQLSSAVAQDELMEGTTTLCGPSLSGFLFTLGQMWPFVTDALSYAASIITLLLIRTPFQRERQPVQRHVLREIHAGISWMWRQPFLRAMTLLMASGAFIFPGTTLAVIVLAEQRQASPWIIGIIFALGGVGSIAGSLLAPFFEKHLTVGHTVLLVRWSFVLLWPLYVLLPVPLLLGLVEFGVGFADPIEDVPYFSYRLSLIPDELRGRVLSACRLFPGAVRPLGLFLTGLLLQHFGAVTTLLLFWCYLLLIALSITFNRDIREARRPDSQ